MVWMVVGMGRWVGWALRVVLARLRDGLALLGLVVVVGVLLLPPGERRTGLRWVHRRALAGLQVVGHPSPARLDDAPAIVWPVAEHTPVTSGFGRRVHPVLGLPRLHTGVDLSVPRGTPIRSAVAGVVERAGDDPINGLHVVVVGGGLRTAYCHLSRLDVHTGEAVHEGEQVGLSGSTGRSTGPHLHFGTWWRGRLVDPLRLRRRPLSG